MSQTVSSAPHDTLRARAGAAARDAARETAEGVGIPLESDDGERRIDRPHPGAVPPASSVMREAGIPIEAPSREPLLREEGAEARSDGAREIARHDGLRVDGHHSDAPNEDELLQQAGQIAQHLRSQIGEMDRREQLLSSQLAALDDERRQMRVWVQRFETDMRQRATRIKSRETELSAKIAQSEQLVNELKVQADDLRHAREELATLRANLREQLEKELQGQRDELAQARSAVEENRKLLAEQGAQNQREHEASILESRRQLEAEWSRLHARVAQDFEKERTQFELDRAAWTAQRDADLQRLARDRESHQESARRDLDEIDTKKRSLSDELQKLRFDHDHLLNDDRRKFEEERDRTRVQLQQERTVFENRARFQTESLQKARGELDAARREFRAEQQQARLEQERAETTLRLRREQIDRGRALLEEREASLLRETEMLARARAGFEAESERDRSKLRLERETWLQERQAQRSELRRQQDLVAVNAQNLEARRERLDHLRAELEETHRGTLEMRMAVEEAWAALCKAEGADAARRRVEQSRHAFAEYYRHLQETIAAHRSELVEAQQTFQRQREEFSAERQTLALWMQERDESLRLWEDELRVDAEQLDLREAAWRAARDRWNQEKIGAEEIIRDLLRQLTHLNGLHGAPARPREPLPATPSFDALLPPLPFDGVPRPGA